MEGVAGGLGSYINVATLSFAGEFCGKSLHLLLHFGMKLTAGLCGPTAIWDTLSANLSENPLKLYAVYSGKRLSGDLLLKLCQCVISWK